MLTSKRRPSPADDDIVYSPKKYRETEGTKGRKDTVHTNPPGND